MRIAFIVMMFVGGCSLFYQGYQSLSGVILDSRDVGISFIIFGLINIFIGFDLLDEVRTERAIKMRYLRKN